MKTIWDAVNWLKGDLENSYNGYIRNETRVIFDRDRKRFGTSLFITHDSDEEEHTCSIEEFNALVTEMSLGLDVNPVNEGYYHKYLAADKELLEPIKQDLIYTQELYDNGDLPSVGMECLINHETHSKNALNKVTVKAITDEYLVVNHDGSTLEQHYHLQDISFKPIPPKLELIDGKAYQFYCDQLTYVGFYRESRKSFFTCLIRGNKICSKTEATNIKPLTVKGE